MTSLPTDVIVGIVGAGAMGSGIAQVAARAGHRVRLVDAVPGAAESARDRIIADLERQTMRGKIERSACDGCIERLSVVDGVGALAEAGLVIEAIVERLDAKIGLFREVEAIVRPEAVLATNTSSLSVTAIAAGLARPHRCVGFHFFNPAPVMRLVEVIAGAQTSAAVVETMVATARSWGKVAVRARSTPGFIVNRVARPFYAEALRLLEEQATDPSTLDHLFVDGAGFRMGPCELMDLIGHDVNFAVTRSVFDAFFGDPRYRPSQIQRDLVDAGWLGRKTGRGFYVYAEGVPRPAPSTESSTLPASAVITETPADGLVVGRTLLMRTDGRSAARVARERGRPVVLHDIRLGTGTRIALTASSGVPAADWQAIVAGLLAGGVTPSRVADRPGLVVTRTLAMLANEAFETALCGVASLDDIDAAMSFGLNFPVGPARWARDYGLDGVLTVLDGIHDETGDPRYRASLGLRLAAGDAR